MSSQFTLSSRAVLAGVLVLIGACDRNAPSVITPAPLGEESAHHAAAAIDSATEAGLRALKRATTPFTDFNVAKAAGYSTQVTACFENLPVGAMGFHWGDTNLFDATLDVTHPEVLLYERQPGGKMQLVGVEFIVPFSAWTKDKPPELLGQVFMKNLTFNVWALHAWVWKANPSGVFADWNPNVHC